MEPRNVTTVKKAKQIVEDRGLEYVKVGVFDIDGIFRGKYMKRAKFLSALEKDFGFCDVVIGWDSNDQLYDNVSITGWHTGYPDVPVRLIPESCRELPLEGNTLLFLGEFAGQAESICPRGLLKRVIEKALEMGFKPVGSCEFEFFVFNETATSIREKNYKDLVPITPGFFGYSLLRDSVHSDFYEELLDLSLKMDFPLEGLHSETGPGVMEAAIYYDDLLAAADKAALFKTYTKILAQKRDWIATFMAKWSPDWAGQSGHIHMSLQNLKGKPLFFDKSQNNNISDLMRYFIGGQQALMPEFLAMAAPTVNSYTRLIPGFWAPTEASWGIDNRTCALRAILGEAESQRVEYRVTAADINPYIALAAALGSGLWGIENKFEPDAPIVGNAYDQEFPKERQLPRTLNDAAERLLQSDPARQLFGNAFVDHYGATRLWEQREFNKHITDWEMDRYFEII
ncbi:MAG: glutamine synthetase [Deltaproteobacteria bacterium]|jgi:glutamine synthetase|nr:glutamine synthetase [Deltaproteobacteria bacterium]MBT4264291.1 glutamine synthetase [Deltaproteobacteria bacterium]MBT4640585.1 glutamine synthetase [Deltaproteobacteria bacterium]MBT6615776.1 glutamine synthetase [Deltaproteobacteria bacterium]MBT7155426.1 glutamine synthetase [Deltaproteobacteria bacterium]